ncbi:DUF3304 domain-containing protein [Pseudoxanthomonas mexicana]|uniref:DUF3304 domain-containing protein n=1 Tax=Pseudoxanthomonas mexicana TaxID=128785 RepID=UPI00398B9626
MNFHSLSSALAWGCMLLPLVACSQEDRLPPTATAQISPYNHTPDYIDEISIDGQGGGNSRAFGGGGSFVCCITYPRQWREGLSATVRWTTSSSDPRTSIEQNIIVTHEKTVPIERYENTGTTLNVHFLPGGEVRLIVTSQAAGSPGYPGPDAPDPPPNWPPWLHAPADAPPLPANAQGLLPPPAPPDGNP